MFIFSLKRTDEIGYDEFDGFVVAAENEMQARQLCQLRDDQSQEKYSSSQHDWINDTALEVKAVGVAMFDISVDKPEPYIVIESYNGN